MLHTIGVGFCVAYPYSEGNAKAWKRGISSRYSSHAFLYMYYYEFLFMERSGWGTVGRKRLLLWQIC